jgi:hypothetical protein
MSNLYPDSLREDIRMQALIENADEDQARAIFLMMVQAERGDGALFNLVWQFGRQPRPSPGKAVALDFSLFGKLKARCDAAEHAAWAGLLIGAALRGDKEGQRLVEAMVRLRVSA